MQPIEYRVWHKTKECYVDHICITSEWIPFFSISPNSIWIPENPADLIIEFFTGILDINGKKIYKWDIIAQNMTNDLKSKWEMVTYNTLSEVVYNQSGYCLRTLNDHWWWPDSHDFIAFSLYEGNQLSKGEIVGNIHENPELIK